MPEIAAATADTQFYNQDESVPTLPKPDRQRSVVLRSKDSPEEVHEQVSPSMLKQAENQDDEVIEVS